MDKWINGLAALRPGFGLALGDLAWSFNILHSAFNLCPRVALPRSKRWLGKVGPGHIGELIVGWQDLS
jgi:hypothetical protein